MVFNSYAFAVFLPIVLVLYYSLKTRWQNVLILVASYFFYAWFDWRFLGLLWLSTVVDYVIGLLLDSPTATAQNPQSKNRENPDLAPPAAVSRPEETFALTPSQVRRRKLIVVVSVILNLGLLGFFKYFNFFIDSAYIALAKLGMGDGNHAVLHIILPLGISFFTFQSMSYTIDVYRGRVRACRDPLLYAVFVAYFPQLVNGPIERAGHMIKQYANPRTVDASQVSSGLLLILIGFVKKVAIADSVALIVDDAFARAGSGSWGQLYAGIWLFAIQIYCDFSGYTDIARGVSRLLGIELMENFQQPYLSRNITEFWRRWHISLSSWLRDYLYIPLGGNRYGSFNTYRNLFLTMFLGGLWHGAALSYIVWGALHGVYLAVHKMILGDRKAVEGPWKIGDVVKLAVTFHLVLLAWVFFRPIPIKQCFFYVKGMIEFRGDGGGKFQFLSGISVHNVAQIVFFSLLVLALDIPQYRKNDHTVILTWPWLRRGLAIAGLVLLLFLMGENNDIPFIYFQF